MTTKQKNKIWFILGKNPELSIAEIISLFNLKKINEDKILKIELNNINSNIINQIGGTIKIAKEIGDELTIDQIKQKIVEILKNKTGKTIFGISELAEKYNRKQMVMLGIAIKKELKENNNSVRYIEAKDKELNAAQIINNKIIEKGGEFLIETLPFEKNKKQLYNLAQTIAVQNVNDWSKRDYGRPASDSLSGMLPPKLAMIMINLSGAKKTGTILDPFCGSGTILNEAIYLGYKNIIGNDISEKAISNSQKNINWLSTEYQIQNVKYELLNEDVKKISQKIKVKSIDAIITEPYLGKPLKGNESEDFLANQARELEELYLNAFKEFIKILKSNGVVIFIIPEFPKIRIELEDKLKKLGFTAQEILPNKKYLTYSRPDAKLKRQVWKFVLSS